MTGTETILGGIVIAVFGGGLTKVLFMRNNKQYVKKKETCDPRHEALEALFDEKFDSLGKEAAPGGEDQIHVTGGLGVVFSKHFQIDAAANIADRNKQLSFSMVYRF